MRTHRVLLHTLTVIALTACQSGGATPEERPALLSNASQLALQELQEVTAKVSGFSDVLLSEKDWMQDSDVVLERRHQRNPQGDLIQGRDIEMPHRVRLLKRANQCLLIDLNTGRSESLHQVQCHVK
ncbi:hypothetical protein H8K32_17105 [Undibacterium jejuense]|uniref:Uncharacterized protein n=1 Tax=Undibacterium jejuense TaxID=1344949 RepID=A0A923HFY7_9BURK|nr:hypothetical protein [Undibacterium jejuense]MBC3863827.1 hypothetical protein [Undibacterium jejuense]